MFKKIDFLRTFSYNFAKNTILQTVQSEIAQNITEASLQFSLHLIL